MAGPVTSAGCWASPTTTPPCSCSTTTPSSSPPTSSTPPAARRATPAAATPPSARTSAGSALAPPASRPGRAVRATPRLTDEARATIDAALAVIADLLATGRYDRVVYSAADESGALGTGIFVVGARREGLHRRRPAPRDVGRRLTRRSSVVGRRAAALATLPEHDDPRQLPALPEAYFVNDLEKSIHQWNELFGAGPFILVPHHKTDRFTLPGHLTGGRRLLCLRLPRRHHDPVHPAARRHAVDLPRDVRRRARRATTTSPRSCTTSPPSASGCSTSGTRSPASCTPTASTRPTSTLGPSPVATPRSTATRPASWRPSPTGAGPTSCYRPGDPVIIPRPS